MENQNWHRHTHGLTSAVLSPPFSAGKKCTLVTICIPQTLQSSGLYKKLAVAQSTLVGGMCGQIMMYSCQLQPYVCVGDSPLEKLKCYQQLHCINYTLWSEVGSFSQLNNSTRCQLFTSLTSTSNWCMSLRSRRLLLSFNNWYFHVLKCWRVEELKRSSVEVLKNWCLEKMMCWRSELL